MKQSIKLLGGAFLLSLPMFLTSCQDILGEWDKPAPVNVTPDDNGGGSTSGTIAYVKYTVSGTTATPSDQQLAEGTYTVVTADLAELTADKPYVVNDDITIGHNVAISGDAEIILCDGKTLTINGYLGGMAFPPTKSLVLYGQSGQTGKLIVRTDDGAYPINVVDLSIHGGDISAKDVGTGNDTQGIYTDNAFNIYNGKVEAYGTMEGVMINVGGKLSIYGGSLDASAGATGGMGGIGISGEIYAYGGTITATGGDADTDDQLGGPGIEGHLTLTGGDVKAYGGNGKANGSGGPGIKFGDPVVVDYNSGNLMTIGGAHGSSGGVNGRGLYDISVYPEVPGKIKTTAACTYYTNDDGSLTVWDAGTAIAAGNTSAAIDKQSVKIE